MEPQERKNKKRKILRRLLGILGFSSALFAFQACYGTPRDFGMDVRIQGVVKSKSSNLPIAGLKVSIANQPQYGVTDSEGKFDLYTSSDSSYRIRIEDVDAGKNGAVSSKDTLVKGITASTFLTISLDVQ